MNEYWYAFALAILASRPLYPEEAIRGIAEGKVPRRESDIVIPDMIAVHKLGEDTWEIVGELFGLSGNSAMSLISQWKRKQKEIMEVPT